MEEVLAGASQFLRWFAFALGSSWFLLRFVPVLPRVTLALAFTMLFSPWWTGETVLLALVNDRVWNSPWPNGTLLRLVSEAAFGGAIGVALSLPILLATLVGRWAGVLAFAGTRAAHVRSRVYQTLEGVFILIAILATFPRMALPAIVQIAAAAPQWSAAGANRGIQDVVRDLVLTAGSAAWSGAVYFAVPVLVVSAGLTFIVALANRYLPRIPSSVLFAVKLPALVMLIGISLYSFNDTVLYAAEKTLALLEELAGHG